MKAYYRLATELDATVGRILEELRSQGQLDNTLVVFTGDNGDCHGEHGLADKWYPYEESIRVPLIVRDPRLAPGRRGTTSDEFVLNVDIAPTILSAAGVAAPPEAGSRLLPALPRGVTARLARRVLLRTRDRPRRRLHPLDEAVVRKDVKYLNWPDFRYEQPFDLIRDPLEEHDLARDPSRSRGLDSLRVSTEE